MTIHLRRWVPVAMAAAVVLCLASGTALAFWRATVSTTSSNGKVTAPNQHLTLTVTGNASSTALFPGASGSVAITLANPYARSVNVASLSGTVTTNDEANCPGASNFTVNANPTGLPTSLTASQAATAYTLSGAVTMNTGAANKCQGLTTITVTYTINGQIP